MTQVNRPHPYDLRQQVFDERGRLRREARESVLAEARCRRRQHSIALVLATPHGPWLAWRDWKPPRGWLCSWLDDADPFVQTGCACHDAVLLMEPEWLARQRGTVVR